MRPSVSPPVCCVCSIGGHYREALSSCAAFLGEGIAGDSGGSGREKADGLWRSPSSHCNARRSTLDYI